MRNWEYYNKVVWPPHYVVPETGLPKAREVFHCRESVHFSPKRMWQACQLIWRTNVDEAITQLDFQQLKSCKILREVLMEAKERAVNEFHIEFPSDMFVADAFPVQCQIIKVERSEFIEMVLFVLIFHQLQPTGKPTGIQRTGEAEKWLGENGSLL
ncbi:hypothetical protein OSTOST_19723 [Ostertagia ostertagi]